MTTITTPSSLWLLGRLTRIVPRSSDASRAAAALRASVRCAPSAKGGSFARRGLPAPHHSLSSAAFIINIAV
jgi:hypothetical protein